MATSSIKCQRQLETVSRAAKGRPARAATRRAMAKAPLHFASTLAAHIQGYIIYTNC